MLYDLNEHTPNCTGIDTFSIRGRRYELGKMPEGVKDEILAIDPDAPQLPQVRPIVERVMRHWNDGVPALSDAEISAIYPLVTNRLHV